MMFLILIIGISSSGCLLDYGLKHHVYVHDRYPVLPTPDRPLLPKITQEELDAGGPELQAQFLKTIKELKIYATQLEEAIKLYNDYAEKKNRKYLEEMGPEPTLTGE